MFSLLLFKILYFDNYVEECVHVWSVSCVQLFITLWTVACQVCLSVGLFRQEYWSGLPFPPPEDLPDPGIESVTSASLALTGRFFTTEPPWKPLQLKSVRRHI